MPTSQPNKTKPPAALGFKSLVGLVASFLLVATGCSTNPNIYYWGNYEPMIYKMYNKPGDATPEVQIERLSLDIQQAENRGKAVHPGLYAHLGMMYAAVGNMGDAIASFEKEKTLFPESEVLIDGMINRATNGKYSRRKGVTPSSYPTAIKGTGP